MGKCRAETSSAAKLPIPNEHDGVLLVDGADRRGDGVSSALPGGEPSAAARESREHDVVADQRKRV